MSDENADEPVTDVLAAEEFVVPAPDPGLTPEHLQLPSDLVGGEPRDVLVAEEFAMPAPDEARVRPPARMRRPAVAPAALALGPVLSALWLWRRLRHRRASR